MQKFILVGSCVLLFSCLCLSHNMAQTLNPGLAGSHWSVGYAPTVSVLVSGGSPNFGIGFQMVQNVAVSYVVSPATSLGLSFGVHTPNSSTHDPQKVYAYYNDTEFYNTTYTETEWAVSIKLHNRKHGAIAPLGGYFEAGLLGQHIQQAGNIVASGQTVNTFSVSAEALGVRMGLGKEFSLGNNFTLDLGTIISLPFITAATYQTAKGERVTNVVAVDDILHLRINNLLDNLWHFRIGLRYYVF